MFPEATWYQFNYNLIDQRFSDFGFFEIAARNNHTLVSRTPFVFGFLAGATHSSVGMSNDHRSTWTQAQCDSWSHAASLFRQLADAEGLTTTQLALLFCLSNKDIRYVIPGAMNVLEVGKIGKLLNLAYCQSNVSIIFVLYTQVMTLHRLNQNNVPSY